MLPKSKKCNKTKKRILKRNSQSFQKKSNFNRYINDDVSKEDKINIEIKNLEKENQKLFNKALQKHNFNSEVYIPHSLGLKKLTNKNNKNLLYELLLAEKKIKKNDKIIIEFIHQTNNITNNYRVFNRRKRSNLKSNMNSYNIEEYLKNKNNILLFQKKYSVDSSTILKTQDYKNDKELLSQFEKKIIVKKNMNSLNTKILNNLNKNYKLTNNIILEDSDITKKNNNRNFYIIKNKDKTENQLVTDNIEYIWELKNDINTTKKSIELLGTPDKKISKAKLTPNYTDNYQLSKIKNLTLKKNDITQKSYSGKSIQIITNFSGFKLKKNSSKIINERTKTLSINKLKNVFQKAPLFKMKSKYNLNLIKKEVIKTKTNFKRRFSRGILNKSDFTSQNKNILNFDSPNTMDKLIDKYRLVYNKSNELSKLYTVIKKYEGIKINSKKSELIENEIKRYFMKYPNEVIQLNKYQIIKDNN